MQAHLTQEGCWVTAPSSTEVLGDFTLKAELASRHGKTPNSLHPVCAHSMQSNVTVSCTQSHMGIASDRDDYLSSTIYWNWVLDRPHHLPSLCNAQTCKLMCFQFEALSPPN